MMCEICDVKFVLFEGSTRPADVFAINNIIGPFKSEIKSVNCGKKYIFLCNFVSESSQ